MAKTLIIIQARMNSTRLPNKVFMTVSGESLISRVCRAARDASIAKVKVAWAHKFPHLDENDVLGRYREITTAQAADIIIRITSDCPLLRWWDITNAYARFFILGRDYYSNHRDGYDVQVFRSYMLWGEFAHKEHVIADFTTQPNGLSVNTLDDLKNVRAYDVLDKAHSANEVI